MKFRKLLSVSFILFSFSSFSGLAYENGFPSDTGFFPIGVWLQQPAYAVKYKAMGINTFVGLWQGPTEIQLSELAKAGMFATAYQNSIGLSSPNRSVIKAWMQASEPDNAQP